jgi:putative holliday junction resolvase
VAVSDSDQRVATGVTVVHRSGDRVRDHQRLADLVAEYGAAGVIVGLPLSLSGGVGPAARAALDEINDLARVVRVPIAAYDERLTTVRASRALAAGGTGGRSRRTVVDQTAAAVMLQSWLDRDEGGSSRA